MGLLSGIVPAHAPAAQLVVLADGDEIAPEARGSLDDEGALSVSPTTRFDLASITKIFTAVAFMSLVEARTVGLDGRVCDLLPEFAGEADAARRVTWRHLLTHTSGLPATWALQATADPLEARRMALAVAPAAIPGARVEYSDLGFIVLGFGIEALVHGPLAEALSDLVIAPAGLRHTGFLPDRSEPVAPTEICPWRGRRLQGEVHDENAAALGGAAGHAGLFGTAADIAAFGRILLRGGEPVLHPATVAEMTDEQASDGAIRRGLGFALWSADPEASSHPFGHRAYGHTGFTGTSLWIDPDRELVVALLTNAVYHGREDRGFAAARIEVHRSVVSVVDAMTRAGGEDS